MEPHMISPRTRRLLFVNLILTCIASAFLSTALTTALPPILTEFSIGAETGQWLSSGYSLAMAVMMPMTAFLITRFPARRLYLTALSIALAGLLICLLARNFPMLMAGRILQACSNGIATSMAQVILLTIYPKEQQGSVMGWYGLSIGAAPVVAPTIAGVFVDTAGWRLLFAVTFGILFCSLIWAFFVFRDVLPTQAKRFDAVSFLLSGAAFGGVTLGIGRLSAAGLSPAALVPLGIGIVGGIVFVRRQLGQEQPFLDVRCFASRRFAAAVAGSMMLYLVMMGTSILLPLYVQRVMGYSATISGLITLPGSLGLAAVGPFAGRLYDRFGMRPLAVFGAAAMFLAAAGMAAVTLDTPLWVPVVLQIARCLGIGSVMMPFVTWGVSALETTRIAHGNALLASLRTTSGAIGMAVFVGIMTLSADMGAEAYGEAAAIHGVNTAFAVMAVPAAVMLACALFAGRQRKKEGGA